MTGKLRSKAQRIGAYGEDLFRLFARRHRLSPTKVEEDLGTDFLCMGEGRPRRDGTAPVLGIVIGACVRTSESYDGRIQLDRSDAEHLLTCDFPTVIALVHTHKLAEQAIHFRFLDRWLVQRLVDFLTKRKSSGKARSTISFTPPAFLPETAFDQALTEATAPGFLESLRITIAHARLASVIPRTQIRVFAAEDGGLTLVELEDFTAQFAISDSTTEGALCDAVFGSPDKLHTRLGRLPIRPELLAALMRLPAPAVVVGQIPAWDYELESVDTTGQATCTFEQKAIPGWFAWVHPSGFSIRISDPRPHEGVYAHTTVASIDAEMVSHLEDHPELWDFLEHCSPTGTLRSPKHPESPPLTTESIGGLIPFSYFATLLRSIRTVPLPHGTFRLQDAQDFEAAITLDTLRQLADDGELRYGFGFQLGPEPADVERPIRCHVPICMNTPRQGLIAWVVGNGRLLYHERTRYGLMVDKITSVEVAVRPDRFPKKNPWPEIPIAPGDKRTLVLSPDPSTDALEPSDPSNWKCSILINFEDSGK